MKTGFRPQRSASPPQEQGPQQDSQQGGGGHEPLVAARHAEFLAHEGQGNAAHKHDQPFEEFAGRGQAPHHPLHAGEGWARQIVPTFPGWHFLDVRLNALVAHGMRGRPPDDAWAALRCD